MPYGLSVIVLAALLPPLGGAAGGEVPARLQLSRLQVTLPDSCPTPDGLFVCVLAGVLSSACNIAYHVGGLPETITSFDDATSGGVVNGVNTEYNSFGQLMLDYQEHAAVVSVGTSPKVGYGYADGSAGHIRPTRVTYPNGRVLRREYYAGAVPAAGRSAGSER